MTSKRSHIIEAVDRRFDEQVEVLKTLVSFKTFRNEEATAQMFIQSKLESCGFAVNRFQTDASLIGKHPAFSQRNHNYGQSWNLVGQKFGAAGGRSLAFNSHVE